MGHTHSAYSLANELKLNMQFVPSMMYVVIFTLHSIQSVHSSVFRLWSFDVGACVSVRESAGGPATVI